MPKMTLRRSRLMKTTGWKTSNRQPVTSPDFASNIIQNQQSAVIGAIQESMMAEKINGSNVIMNT